MTLLMTLICLLLTACKTNSFHSQYNGPINLSDDITLEEISPGIWLHTTYTLLNGKTKVGANGLLIIDEQTAVMIDTPWTDEQTGILFDWVKEKHHADIQSVVPTHFHIDCAGGLKEAHRRGAESIALNKTIQLMDQANTPRARKGFDNTYNLVENSGIELSFIGAGHTIDNIVVWVPDHKVLFAGCLLKGLNFKSIGNTADADLDSYPKTLNRMKLKYSEAVVVVPGHGETGGLEIIDHTANMLQKHIDYQTQKTKLIIQD